MLPIEVNGSMIGILLKELVRRAMLEIRKQRFTYETTAKAGYGSSDMTDVFTSADTAAQEIFAKLIRETLPGVGIVGEEGLNVPCTIPGRNIYVTIDPLDGTKAFVRRQSHGVATMVALVVDGEVVSAWIGDVNTFEIFGYRPGSNKVHRISNLEVTEDLSQLIHDGNLNDKYILLREGLETYPPTVLSGIRRFKKYHIDGGSIGTWFARLWKGEYAAVITDPGHDTPWDCAPFIGISQKLGYVFLTPTQVVGLWEEFEPVISEEILLRESHVLVIHRSRLAQFLTTK